MEFFSNAFEALPAAASSPYAFICYIAVLGAFAYRIKKVNQLKTLLSKLPEIPSGDRAKVIMDMFGKDITRTKLTGEQYLRYKISSYRYAVLALLCITLVVVFAIAIQKGEAVSDDFDDKLDTNTLLSLQNRSVRSIGLGVTLKRDVLKLPSGCSFIAYLTNRDRDSYRLAIPLFSPSDLVISADGSMPPGDESFAAIPGAFVGVNTINSSMSHGLNVNAITIKNSELTDEDQLFQEFADLYQVTFSISTPVTQKDSIEAILSAIEFVRIAIDGITVINLTQKDQLPMIIESTLKDSSFVRSPCVESMFFRGGPNWQEIIGLNGMPDYGKTFASQ